LSSVFKDHTSKQVIDKITTTFSNFTKPESNDENLYTIARSKVDDLLDEQFTQLCDILETEVDKLSESGVKTLSQIKNCLQRIDSLTSKMNVFEKGFNLYENYYKVVNQCLEITLEFLKACHDTPNEYTTQIDTTCTKCIESAIEFLTTDLVNLCNQVDIEDMDTFQTRKDRLINFSEAVVCDSSGETFGIVFNLFQKYVCLKVLTVVFPVFSGVVVEKNYQFARPPLDIFCQKAFVVLDDLMGVCGERFWLVKENCEKFGFEMLFAYSGVVKLVADHDLISVDNAWHVMKYYGQGNFATDFVVPTEGDEEEEESQQKLVRFGIFGDSFDGISDKILSKAIEQFPVLLHDIYKAQTNLETKLTQVSNHLNQTAALISKSIKSVFFKLTSN
jgi:hypothetical protein